MLRNYLKTTFRNLWKHKIFSFINLAGLAIGLAAFFLIFLYVRFELSYDGFHSKADRIYRLVSDIRTPTETINAGGPSWAVASHAAIEFPEIESFVRISGESFLIRKGETKFQEDNTLYADSSFFHVFDFKLLRGDPRTALKEPLSIVFSESAAKKYFGKENPIGQTVLFTVEALPARVTGIMADIPENSQIKADMLVSMSTLTQKFRPGLDDQWGNYGLRAYLLLKPGADAKKLEARFPAFLEKRNGEEMKKLQMYPTLFLEPLKFVYLHSTRDGNQAGNINNVYIFSVVAVFILLIACFNFINLATARSAERAREVGIRKVAGAARIQLAKQFIGESVVLCLLSFFLAFLLVLLLRPLFNQLCGKIISKGIFEHPLYLLILLLTALGMGVVAGVYPALVLSSFQPVVVLKGRFSGGAKGLLLRKGLVVLQFTISIALIISTLVVFMQMKFMQSQDLGFNKDQIMVIDTHGDPARNALQQEVNALPGIKSTAMSSSIPGGGNMGAYSEIENVHGDLQIANLDLYFVDWNYIPQLNIKILAGRAFSKDFLTDTTQAMVLNEAAVKMFGYRSPEEAVGKRFKQWGREGKIIGVMKDFHFRSLQHEIKPLSMRIEPEGTELLTVKLAGGHIQDGIRSIEQKWKTMIPNRPFSFYFLDEYFDRQYRSEARFGRLFVNFAVLAILISCLGLLGLASYSTMQRTKEIGVRKVVGASVASIVGLLSRDFIKLVLLSFLVAAPLAWFFMHQWLQGFAYRIGLGIWVFLAAGATATLIAMVTVSFQAVKAAIANPVKSLRTE